MGDPPESSFLYPRDLPKRTLRMRAEQVLNALTSRPSLGSKPSDRLQRLCKKIAHREDPEFREGTSEYQWAQQSLKDLQEYSFVFDVLGARLESEPFLSVVRRSLDDDALIADDAGKSPGRDAQFELYVAAIGVRAGFDVERGPIGRTAPDWSFVCPAVRMLVECTRIRSAQSYTDVAERVRKKAAQIDAHSHAGVVVVDTSLLVDEKQVHATVPDDAIEDAVRRRGRHRHGFLGPALVGPLSASGVGLVILHDFVIRPNSPGRGPLLAGSWDALSFRAAGTSTRAYFDEFWTLFGHGLPQY